MRRARRNRASRSNWTTRNTGTRGPQGPYQPDYGSGWMNISTKTGQYFNITHNLNSADLTVDITGKTQTDGGAYYRYFGLTGYVPGWNKTYGGDASDAGYSVVRTSDGSARQLVAKMVLNGFYSPFMIWGQF
jgi:hypothetical protein